MLLLLFSFPFPLPSWYEVYVNFLCFQALIQDFDFTQKWMSIELTSEPFYFSKVATLEKEMGVEVFGLDFVLLILF